MVRLADLSEIERKGMLGRLKELAEFRHRSAWVKPAPLAQCRVAIITTAGIHRQGDVPFKICALFVVKDGRIAEWNEYFM